MPHAARNEFSSRLSTRGPGSGPSAHGCPSDCRGRPERTAEEIQPQNKEYRTAECRSTGDMPRLSSLHNSAVPCRYLRFLQYRAVHRANQRRTVSARRTTRDAGMGSGVRRTAREEGGPEFGDKRRRDRQRHLPGQRQRGRSFGSIGDCGGLRQELTHRTVAANRASGDRGRTGRIRFVRAGLASGACIGGQVPRTTCSRTRFVRNGRRRRVARPQMQRLAANGHYRVDGQSPESNQPVPDAHAKMPVCLS